MPCSPSSHTPGNEASAAPLIREAIDRGEIFRAHGFKLACAQSRIDHRLTKPHHPWTNGQVERMNRTLKDATVRRYHDARHDELRRHLGILLDAYNYARRLKTLKGLTPYEFICRSLAGEPHRFAANPHHQMPGPNIAAVGSGVAWPCWRRSARVHPAVYGLFIRRVPISHGAFTRAGPTPCPILRTEAPMLDLLLLALGVGLFGLMAAYVAGCERV